MVQNFRPQGETGKQKERVFGEWDFWVYVYNIVRGWEIFIYICKNFKIKSRKKKKVGEFSILQLLLIALLGLLYQI